MRNEKFLKTGGKNEKQRNVSILVLFLMLIVSFGFWILISSVLPIMSDFENNLWRPSYLLLQGMSPYNTHVMFEGLHPIWFPVIIALFLPLGALPIQIASNIWFLIGLMTLFTIIVILARRVNVPSIIFALMAVAIGFFPSTLTHFSLGQVSLLVSLLLVILSVYYQKFNPSLIGLLLALSLVKPQLIVIFFPTFITVLWRRDGARKVFKVMFYTLIWFFLLTLPLFILYPNWIPDFVQNLLNNPNWAYPTPYSFLRASLSSNLIIFGLAGVYLLFGIGLAIKLSYRLGRLEALLWSMALTPVFSPMVWSWDFVMMYPLLLYLAFDRKCKVASNIVIIGFGICLTLFVVMKNQGYINDKFAVWVPLFLTATMLISMTYRRKCVPTY